MRFYLSSVCAIASVALTSLASFSEAGHGSGLRSGIAHGLRSARSLASSHERGLSSQANSSVKLTAFKINGYTFYSNNPKYTLSEARADLRNIMTWAHDLENLSPYQRTETVAAIFDVAHRYFPELPTKKIFRAILADIRAESDFDPYNVSPGRLDSGDSIGMMQVSQSGSKELTLFQKHALTKSSPAGPLSDWPMTGATLKLKSLRGRDLRRPWINIHIAGWVQANLAKTGSLDPYDWEAYSAGNLTRGGGLKTDMRVAFGSWCAGPHPSGNGGYLRKNDDVSDKYLRHIMQGVNVLYSGADYDATWLEGLVLKKGLVDYRA